MRLQRHLTLSLCLLVAASSLGCSSPSGSAQQTAAGQPTPANTTGAQQTTSPQANASPVAGVPGQTAAAVSTTGGSATTGANATPAPATVADACALLSSDDIKAVQGEAVSAKKPSRRTDSPFVITQCFYTTPTFTKSVSLEVTERGTSSQSVRDFWKANFARAEDKREAKNERRKLKGKPLAGEPAKPVSGIGDEAYWISTNANSTLYAFKKETLIRISIGGADSEDARKQKIRTLAEKVLARL